MSTPPRGHEDCPGCEGLDRREKLKQAVGDVSDVAFNDPGSWGFCEFCAMDVTVADGVMVPHRFARMGHNEEMCTGSSQPAAEHRPFTARQRKRVSLFKSPASGRRRAMYLRFRMNAREKARREAAGALIVAQGANPIKAAIQANLEARSGN